MREIKFRAWNNKEKLWASGSEVYLRLDGKSMAEIIGDKLAICGIDNNEDIVIEQYTGLIDRYGKEIYEGDILRFCGLNVVVEWEDYDCRFITKDDLQQTRTLWILSNDKYEVIGNIHENPELLKEKK